MTHWIVVLLGGTEQECGLDACPGSAHGPFTTAELAREFALERPDESPHVLAVQKPVWRDRETRGSAATQPAAADGHGHVTARSDGARAKCGGPARCDACAKELAAYGDEVVIDRQGTGWPDD